VRAVEHGTERLAIALERRREPGSDHSVAHQRRSIARLTMIFDDAKMLRAKRRESRGSDRRALYACE
jgi:hypothetical protein